MARLTVRYEVYRLMLNCWVVSRRVPSIAGNLRDEIRYTIGFYPTWSDALHEAVRLADEAR
jgi:hypothetical protein